MFYRTYIKKAGFAFFLLLYFISSCDNIPFFSGKLDEGTIEYDIKYLEDEKSNPLISLLPTTMCYKFREDSYTQKIEGWMSTFVMSGIYDVKKKTNTATLKILNEKYYYQTTLDGPSFGFDSLPPMKIDLVNETKEIAGFKCKKAVVSFPGTDVENITIFYTDEIKISNPNKNNPFHQVEGVLMEYRMSFRKIKMAMKATKVTKGDIQDEEFDIPRGYEKVSRDRIQEVISNLI